MIVSVKASIARGEVYDVLITFFALTAGVLWSILAFVCLVNLNSDGSQLTADYDAVSLSPLPVSPPSFHTTVFPVADETILSTADKLIANLRQRHYYTDTANFDLKCGICGTGLKGEKAAQEHAMKTGRESHTILREFWLM